MRIATWNLARPWKNGKTVRADRQRDMVKSVQAQVWILTETYRGFTLDGYQSVSSPSSLGSYDESESAAAIWVPSAWSLRGLSASHLAVWAEAVPPNGPPLLICGLIISWRDKARGPERQAAEWRTLRRAYPEHFLCIAGDFNMTLHSDEGYGSRLGRKHVRDALHDLNLRCVTAVNIRDKQFDAIPRDNIDHICLDERFCPTGEPSFWFDERLSDHNGVAIDVELLEY